MAKFARSLFLDEAVALEFVENHVWPEGPVCPHCGSFGRIARLNGASTRFGTYKCYSCRKPFTVKVGTIFESSHVPVHLWLRAIYLTSTTQGALSANQLHRALGVTVRTGCFIKLRIERALREADATEANPGAGKKLSAGISSKLGPRALAVATREQVRELRDIKTKRPTPEPTRRGAAAAKGANADDDTTAERFSLPRSVRTSKQ